MNILRNFYKSDLCGNYLESVDYLKRLGSAIECDDLANIDERSSFELFCCRPNTSLSEILPCLTFHSETTHCAVHLKTDSSCDVCTHKCEYTVEEKLREMIGDFKQEPPNLRFRHFSRDGGYEPSYKPFFNTDAENGIRMAALFISQGLLHRAHHKNTSEHLQKLKNLETLGEGVILVEEGTKFDILAP